MDWTYMYGDQCIKITVEGITDAIDTARSLILKELEFNERIKESDQFRHDYEKKLEILRVLQRNILGAFDIMERETVHLIVPNKRKKK